MVAVMGDPAVGLMGHGGQRMEGVQAPSVLQSREELQLACGGSGGESSRAPVVAPGGAVQGGVLLRGRA